MLILGRGRLGAGAGRGLNWMLILGKAPREGLRGFANFRLSSIFFKKASWTVLACYGPWGHKELDAELHQQLPDSKSSTLSLSLFFFFRHLIIWVNMSQYLCKL